MPMIMGGPDVPEGKVVQNACFFWWIVFQPRSNALRAKLSDEDLPGRSLWQIAREDDQERTVFKRVSRAGHRARHLYVCAAIATSTITTSAHSPQLFDLAEDPDELNDFVRHPRSYQDLLRDLRKREFARLARPRSG